MLSDDVLLEIFDFCKKNHDPGPRYEGFPEAVWDWQILVYVCQRWRQVVSASPLRLDLRILCTYGTPVRKYLDVWPTIPINIDYFIKTVEGIDDKIDEDNLIVALGHTDRVSSICSVEREPTGARLLRKMVTVMQEPFPALTHLLLSVFPSKDVPVLPSEFLGRSAPCLQKIVLSGIPFPALPVLLLSTSHLVQLHLHDIPRTGYIPPEAMVAALTMLTMLEDLAIEFQSPAPRPDQIRLPPITRTVLPALTSFDFYGVREYLEDFVERINAPRLHTIWTIYLNQLIDFEIPHLWRFIDHSEDLNQPRYCLVNFKDDVVSFSAGPTTEWHIPESESYEDFPRQIDVKILCEGIDWQVSHLAQALNQISAATVLSHILHFSIDSESINRDPEDIMEDIEWMQLLRPFSSVQTLFVSKELAAHISRSLENTGSMMATEVLPALDMLCLEDQPMTFAHKFIAARWESGHPVTTVDTKRAFQERLKSYS